MVNYDVHFNAHIPLVEINCYVTHKPIRILKKITYRASFYGLSGNFLRAIGRVFIRCMACEILRDNRNRTER